MYKVVIADDEVLIRMYIREILENNGFEVVGEAEDGLDAITVCKQKHPDFVIMDVNMPVMTGLEAARVIHEDKLAGFVMILTAYRDKEIADQAVDMDVMGYIVKPVDEEMLRKLTVEHRLIVTLEENIRRGGFGEFVTAYLAGLETDAEVLNLALPDDYIEHGSVDLLRSEVMLDIESCVARIITAYIAEESRRD